MSHGGGGDDENIEPDLTPLLDLVLQLLMFFIINVNFVSDQVNPAIKLPVSASALPMGKPADDDILLNQKNNTPSFRREWLTPDDQQRLRNYDSIVMVS